MNVFEAAHDRVIDFAHLAQKAAGSLTVKHLATAFAKGWQLSRTGGDKINLYRTTDAGCEYATITIDGGGLDRVLTPSEIQQGLPVMLRKQA